MVKNEKNSHWSGSQRLLKSVKIVKEEDGEITVRNLLFSNVQEKWSGGKLIIQVEFVAKTDNTENCNKQIASKFKLTNNMMKIQKEK